MSGKANVSDDLKQLVSVEPLPELVGPRRRDLDRLIGEASDNEKIQKWLFGALLIHRMRRYINDQCVARIVIGGKPSKYSG